MNKFLNFIVVCLMVFMPIMACKSLSFDGSEPTPGSELVVTTIQELTSVTLPQSEMTIVDLTIVPDEVEVALGANEFNPIIITTRQNVREDSTKVLPIEGVHLDTQEGWVDWLGHPAVIGIVGSLLAGLGAASPWVLGLEALLSVFSKRKREHYGNAVKSLAHLNAGEAVKSAVKALGAMHSDAGTKVEQVEPTPTPQES